MCTLLLPLRARASSSTRLGWVADHVQSFYSDLSLVFYFALRAQSQHHPLV